jgi:ribosomal protein L13E
MSGSGKRKAKPATKKSASGKKNAKVAKTKRVVKATPASKPTKVVPRVRKPVEKKEAPAKQVIEVERLELGPRPTASVVVRHLDAGSMHERAARGFSLGELASAGVPLNAAKREGLALDIRRRSVVEGNVGLLKGWFKNHDQSSAGESAEKQVAVVAATKKKQTA